MKQGVITGTDSRTEWMLAPWWEAYRKHNDLPVAVGDHGMTEEARRWCCSQQIHLFDAIPPFENVMLAKPIAIADGPFEISVWTDIDCEIRGSLLKIFDSAPHGFAATLAGVDNVRNIVSLFTGVIVAEKRNSLLEAWAEMCRQRWIPAEYEGLCTADGEQHITAEWVLNGLINRGVYDYDLLEPKWQRGGGDAEDTNCAVYHYFGPSGKQRLAAKHGITIGG